MPTDDERREVAEFLRRSVGKGASLLLLVAFAAFEVKSTDGERIVTADEAALRLADLIDPGEGHFDDPGKMVDRGALLKLADEYDEKSARMREKCEGAHMYTIRSSFDKGALWASAEIYGDAARRIRDALGG